MELSSFLETLEMVLIRLNLPEVTSKVVVSFNLQYCTVVSPTLG